MPPCCAKFPDCMTSTFCCFLFLLHQKQLGRVHAKKYNCVLMLLTKIGKLRTISLSQNYIILAVKGKKLTCRIKKEVSLFNIKLKQTKVVKWVLFEILMLLLNFLSKILVSCQEIVKVKIGFFFIFIFSCCTISCLGQQSLRYLNESEKKIFSTTHGLHNNLNRSPISVVPIH